MAGRTLRKKRHASRVGAALDRLAPPERNHRARELEFRNSHPEAFQPFAGQWVVLEREDIVAHGHDPVLVVAEARSKGVRIPYVFRVEEQGDDTSWIGL